MALNTIEALRKALDDAYRLDYPAATIDLAHRLLQIDPENSLAWLRLGTMLSETAKYDEAEQALRMALCHCSQAKRHLVFGLMGFLFKNRGDYEEAAEWFRAVIDAKPDDADGHIWLGGVFARKGELIEAEYVYRKATMCKNGCIDEAYHNLGLVLRAQGKIDEALQCFEKAIAIDPGYKEAKHALADVKAAIGYRSEATT